MRFGFTGADEYGAPNDTLRIGRFSIHFCGPWDYGAPLRLHLNWFFRGSLTKEGHVTLDARSLHFAVALRPNAKFAQRLGYTGRRRHGRWTSWSSPGKRTRERRAWEEVEGHWRRMLERERYDAWLDQA